MTPRLDWEILNRYISGESNSADDIYIREWAEGDEERHAFINALLDNFNRSDENNHEYQDAQSMWARHLAARGRTSDNLNVVDADTSVNRWSKRFITPQRQGSWKRAIALVFTAVVLAIAGIKSVTDSSSSHAEYGMNGAREIVTAAGQRSTLELTDGSQLVIAPSSKVRVSKTFGQDTRTIEVEGEVFVTAAPNAEVPFIVIADNVITRVLGTSFSVRKYSEDEQVRVVVLDGRVSVGDAIAGAGDVAVAGAGLATTVTSIPDAESIIGWTSGVLSYRNAPVDSVILELNRAYGIQISVNASELLYHRINADFNNQNVDSMLEDLSMAIGAGVSRMGSKAVLDKRQ